ncbi:MAG: hypothetical protein GEV09_00135 [Pseudonocardiaceae bacterium]|nr:hypothetical protein [Pseudonocardiaceae bacterium]
MKERGLVKLGSGPLIYFSVAPPGFLRLPDCAAALPGAPDQARALAWWATATPGAAYSRSRSTRPRPAGQRRGPLRLPARAYTLADFGYAAKPGVDETLIRDLASVGFLDEAANVLFIGPPGWARPCSRSGWPAPRSRPGTGSISPPLKTSPPAAPAPPVGAGTICCGSTSGPKMLVIDEVGYP